MVKLVKIRRLKILIPPELLPEIDLEVFLEEMLPIVLLLIVIPWHHLYLLVLEEFLDTILMALVFLTACA